MSKVFSLSVFFDVAAQRSAGYEDNFFYSLVTRDLFLYVKLGYLIALQCKDVSDSFVCQ